MDNSKCGGGGREGERWLQSRLCQNLLNFKTSFKKFQESYTKSARIIFNFYTFSIWLDLSNTIHAQVHIVLTV